VFLRSRSRGRETWGWVIFGLALCVISVLGLTGAFGELGTVGRGETIVLFGVPLGLLAIGTGIANWIRGWSDPGGEEVEDPAHAGDRAGLPDAEAPGPHATGPHATGPHATGRDAAASDATAADVTGPDATAPDGMIDR
jgi:hypothetical protein